MRDMGLGVGILGRTANGGRRTHHCRQRQWMPLTGSTTASALPTCEKLGVRTAKQHESDQKLSVQDFEVLP